MREQSRAISPSIFNEAPMTFLLLGGTAVIGATKFRRLASWNRRAAEAARGPDRPVSAVCALWNFGLAGWCLYPLARGCRAPRRMKQ